LLFGLDMLKAHQACIDLQKGVLRIQGREVPFLPEHQIPQSSVNEETELQDASSVPNTSGSTSTPPQASHRSNPSNTPQPSRFPETDIRRLMDLGVTREIAISALDAAGGNVDLAAGYIF
jgi:DNA damage-inducible protein 1